MDIRTKQIVSVFLALASTAGVVGTAYLAVKNDRAYENKTRELLNKKSEASKKELMKLKAKTHATTILVGGATVASILASHILSRRAEVSLIAGATLVERGWKRYQYKVKDILGIENHRKVIEALADDDSKNIHVKQDDSKKLYYVEPIGFFKAKPEDLAWAYGDMNQRLHTVDNEDKTAYFCLLYNMLVDAKAELLNKDIPSENLNWGWSYDYLKDNGLPNWVHMTLTDKKTESGQEYTLLEFDEQPILDPSCGGSAYIDCVGDSDEINNEDAVKSSYKKVNKKGSVSDE